MKHIVLYTDDPEFGGVAQYNHNVLMALVRQGHRVTCIQPQSASPLTEEQALAGINHVWIGYDAKNDFTRSITDTADAERVLGGLSPDLLYFSDCCPISNLAAKHVALKRGIPFVVVVNFVAKYLAEKFRGCLGVLARQHAQAEQVVAVSRENLEELHRSFGTPLSKGVVIHYGRPAKYFEPIVQDTRDRLRVEMGLPFDAVVCFSAARLTEIKGFGHIVAAASLLKNSPAWKNLFFVWAGAGELKNDLQVQINACGMEDHFRLLGQRWDVCDLLGAADIFLLPSHFEGMPLSIMEAMARRLPVIASSVSGIPEELGDTGCLIADPSIDAAGAIRGMAKAISEWAIDPVVRMEMGKRGHARAIQYFREELMVARVLELVETALKQSTGRPVVALGAAPASRSKSPLCLSLDKQLQGVLSNGSAAIEGAIERLERLIKREAPLRLTVDTEYRVKSPVCMVVFNRTNHTARVFAAVRRARPTKLLIVADGPRADRPGEPVLCDEVRRIVTQVDWPCEVQTNFAKTNFGCTKRVVSGLDWVFQQEERCIIIEDDCLPSPDFFRFCDEMLEKYKDEDRVRCVSGNNFQFGLPRGDGSYFFTHNVLIWGWATWRRAWKKYDLRMRDWPSLRTGRFLFSRFGDPKTCAYWARAFDAAHAGRTAWDYPWVFSCWSGDGVGVCPAVDLIENIGFDHQATGNIANVHPLFINLYAKLPIGQLSRTIKAPTSRLVDVKAAAFNQRFHYEQDWPLLRREMATAFLGMDDQEFASYLERNGADLPIALVRSGLSSLPVTDQERPLITRCELLLARPGAKLQHVLAAALLVAPS